MKKKLFIIPILCIILIVPILVILTSNSEILISELDDNRYVNSFEQIRLVEVGNNQESYTCIYNDDILEVVQAIKDLKLVNRSLTKDRSRNRNYSKYIFLKSNNNSYIKLFFDDNISNVWIDSGLQPSLTYKIKNNEALSDVFEPLSNSVNENITETSNGYIDGNVKKVNDQSMIVENNSKIFIISVNTVENDKELFREGEAIRIKCSNDSVVFVDGEELENVEKIFYLNEFNLKVQKNDNESLYHSDESIHQAIEDTIENTVIQENKYSFITVYYDENDAKEYLTKKYGDANRIKNKIVISLKSIPSKSFDGDTLSMEAEMYGLSFRGYNEINVD